VKSATCRLPRALDFTDRTALTVTAFYQDDPETGHYGAAPPIGSLAPNPNGRLSTDFYDGDVNSRAAIGGRAVPGVASSRTACGTVAARMGIDGGLLSILVASRWSRVHWKIKQQHRVARTARCCVLCLPGRSPFLLDWARRC